MALKCLICSDESESNLSIKDRILGKDLLTIIQNISGLPINLKAVQNSICQTCAVALIQADSVVKKVRTALIHNVQASPSEKNSAASLSSSVNKSQLSNQSAPRVTEAVAAANDASYSFQCTACPYTADRPKLFKKHLLVKHNIENARIYKCQYCSEAYKLHFPLKRHIANAHGTKQISNNELSLPSKSEIKNETANKSKLQNANIAKASAGGDAQVLQPPKNLKNNTVSDTTNNNGQQFTCELCSYKSTNAKLFKSHLLDKHQIEKPRIYKCGHCSETYQLKYALDRHVENIHEKRQLSSPMVKPKEKKSNIQENRVNNSIDITFGNYDGETEDYEHKKPIANSTLKVKSDKKIPKLQTGATTPKKQNPNKLKKKYTESNGSFIDAEEVPAKVLKLDENESNLSTIDITEEVDSYACILCPFSVKRRKTLKKHMMSEHQIEKHQMHQYVEKKQKNEETITEEQHRCSFCGKQFINITELRAHVDISHMADTHKNCPNCGKSFRSEEKYEAHVFSEKCRTSIHPCQYPNCPKRFSRLNRLSEHMLKIHKSV